MNCKVKDSGFPRRNGGERNRETEYSAITVGEGSGEAQEKCLEAQATNLFHGFGGHFNFHTYILF